MSKIPCCTVLLAAVLLLPMAAPAQVHCPNGVTLTPLAVSPLTIRFRDASIGIVFLMLQKMTATEFRVPADLTYRVTFDIRKVPACHVLEIIGESQSLTYRQEGDTIVVVSPEPLPPPVALSAAPPEQSHTAPPCSDAHTPIAGPSNAHQAPVCQLETPPLFAP